jgi:cobalamin biosynthesis Mg chelatase CobN
VKLIRFLLSLACLVVATTALAGSAVALRAQTTQPSATTQPPTATPIGNGLAFTSAVITSPADPNPRTMNNYQTAVFVQSWLPTALYGKPEIENPPANVPVYRVDITGTWGSQPGLTGKQTVYYASDGTKAWVSYPQNQDVTMTPTEPPPGPATWFVPPHRVIDAFNGTAQLVETSGVDNANNPAGQVVKQPDSSGSSSTPWIVYAIVVGAAVVIIVGGVMFFRRRRSPDDLAPAD